MVTAQSLCLVIPTRNRFAQLTRCLASVAHSSVKPSAVIVVDDQSSDETKTLAADSIANLNIRILRPLTRVMMAGARNLGAQATHHDLIIFIDDDNVIDPRMIELLVDAANRYPTFGQFGPVMYTLKTGQVQTAYQRISLMTGHTYGPAVIPATAMVKSDGIPNVFMVRQSVFEQVGYFDTALLATYSEADLAWRALRAGWQCGIVTAAKTFHDNHPHRRLLPRTMGGGTFPQKSYCMIRNRMIMVSRYGRCRQQIIFFICFSWLWPLVYSVIMTRYCRYDLIRFYWLGWRDGLRYAITGHLVNSFNH